MKETFVNLTEPIKEKDYQNIELYRKRFKHLWQNWESLKKQGTNLGGSFSKHGAKSFRGSSCNIESFRLKGCYVDFRFFCAEGEPTNYFKVAKIIGKHCKDARIRNVLKANKEMWKKAGILQDWTKYSADDFIDYWFNGDIFHVKHADKREEIDKLHELMNSELAHHLLTFAIYDRMLVVRNLNWLIEPLSQMTQKIRLPEMYA
jgi:hypothetical protein